MSDTPVCHWNKDIKIYRAGPLVYVRTLKCASTYYSQEFALNGWNQELFGNIDWQNDHVFSFIMDPMVRRIKGIAEFICMYPASNMLLKQHEIFWQKLLCLDFHSIPYHLMYHEYVRKIDWIPIDATYPSEELVIKLCQFHGRHIQLSGNRQNESEESKKIICQQIDYLTGNGSAEMYLGLQPDIDLYRDVCTNIDYSSKTWDKVSWLR